MADDQMNQNGAGRGMRTDDDRARQMAARRAVPRQTVSYRDNAPQRAPQGAARAASPQAPAPLRAAAQPAGAQPARTRVSAERDTERGAGRAGQRTGERIPARTDDRTDDRPQAPARTGRPSSRTASESGRQTPARQAAGTRTRRQAEGRGASRPSARSAADSPERASRGAAGRSAQSTRGPRTGNAGSRRSPNRTIRIAIAAVAACAVVAIGVFAFTYLRTITVTVNSKTYEINGAKTVQTAYEASGLKLRPGDYTDVTGEVLEAGKGKEFDATVNGEEAEAGTKLSDGDAVVLTNGSDILEDYDGVDTEIPATFLYEGSGALGVFTGTGEPGIQTKMTGKVSGKTATRITKEPGNIVFKRYEAQTKGEKVIALTFDDGPWGATQEILDVLAANNAKATFFVVGNQLESPENIALVKAELEAGHQVCTHTYSHAESGRTDGKTGSLGYMTDEQVLTDVTKGLDAIATALGTTASTVMRAPSGYFDGDIAKVLQGKITAEINWDIDTEDWKQPGVSTIVTRMLTAFPGAVILFHDGGGDRSQTVEALRQALPVLAGEGYRFVTIDELLAYEIPL